MKKILFLVLSAMLLSMLTVVAFAESVEYFYVNSETGDDHATAADASSAVKTFTQACRLANESGADKAYIVITNEYAIPKTAYEVEHTVPFVLTTNDGKVDYGASGAKVVFGSSVRYVLKGNTTFENITIEYTKSVNFVAQYNHITFGKGVTTKRLDAEGSGIYVVGGWQSPSEDKAKDLDSHVTIESGSFNVVVGGTRQTSGGVNYEFSGIHNVTINGGDINTLYCGSTSNHTSNSIKLTVNGGSISSLSIAGDKTRSLSGNAEAYLNGGEITQCYVNNVMGTTKIKLGGAKVERMSVSYYDSTLEKAAKAAGATQSLVYSGHFYTAEEIASYTGFTTVTNDTIVYASAKGSGDGQSEKTPTSFENAMSIVAKVGGTVKLLDEITISDYSEPSHDKKIILEGAGTGAKITVKGTYTLGGETELSSLTLGGGGKIDALSGSLVVNENLKYSSSVPAISGSATLFGGSFAKIDKAKVVTIDGATVKEIIGGTTEAIITVNDGKVGTIKSTDSSIKDFSLTMLGGKVETVIFSNITNRLSYTVVGGSVASYKNEGSNVQGTLHVSDDSFNTSSLGEAEALFAVSEGGVFFLADGGDGSGSSALDPSSSIHDAYAALSSSGGTIVISGAYTVKEAFVNVTNEKPLVITSLYDGIDYAKTNNAALILVGNFYCGGETEFCDITLTSAGSYRSIYAGGYKVVLGDNIKSTLIGTDTYLSVMGGNQKAITDGSTNLTINSGIWQRVRGGTAADGSTNATVNLTINGGEFLEPFTLGSSASHDGDINVVINGGTFYQSIYAATLSKAEHSFNSKVSLTINGGTFYGRIAPAKKSSAQYVGSYSGSFDVVINGGDFVHLTELIGAQTLASAMTSTLKVADNIDLDAEFTGKVSFTNPIKQKGDPWLFYHDGYYYLTGSAAYGTTVCKAPNIADLKYAEYEKVYSSEIESNWSAEIHHFTDEEVGEGNGGWYCFIGSPEDGVENAVRRMYVIKCLDGDNIMGRWGNPITGEVNKPQRVNAPDVDDYENWWGAGQSTIRIDGKVYSLFVSEVGRNTADFHQTINIIEMENPWTLKGKSSVICKPDYDWEKHGYSYNPNSTGKNKAYPAVVEGATALYADDGTVFLTYTGSGVWTTEYQIGYMKFLGGDPLNPSNWEKNPTSIVYKSDEICGTGHGSFVKDTDGQTWICYHAYTGTQAGGGTSAYLEPVTANKDGVSVGNGSGIAAPLSTVYEMNVNPLPLGKRISGFDSISSFKSERTEVKLTIGSSTAYINGTPSTLDAAPINRNNRTMLPVRFLANAFGVTNDGIKWDAATRTATLTNTTTTIVVTIDAPTMTVNGESVVLDSPAIIESNRTYLPVRAIANALGVSNDNIAWDAATNTATLVK